MKTPETSLERFARKAREARRRAQEESDPWLKKALEEVANAYRLLFEKELHSYYRQPGKTPS